MLKKIITLIGIAITAAAGFAVFNSGQDPVVAAHDVEATVSAAMEARILDSTIQIELFDHGRIEGNQRIIQTSRGFGTIVQSAGRRFILTHNHWSIPANELSRTEIRNGAGGLLLELDGPAFYQLIRYRDGGTMLLDAPQALASVQAAELGDSQAVEVGSTVWLATFDIERGQGIQIEKALVNETDGTVFPGRLLLKARETAVISGDSGGGVWADGRLVANLWTIQVAEQKWGLGITLQRQTGSISAGMQPLAGDIGLTSDDLSFTSQGQDSFERGGPE